MMSKSIHNVRYSSPLVTKVLLLLLVSSMGLQVSASMDHFTTDSYIELADGESEKENRELEEKDMEENVIVPESHVLVLSGAYSAYYRDVFQHLQEIEYLNVPTPPPDLS